jgi:hypothetical protein
MNIGYQFSPLSFSIDLSTGIALLELPFLEKTLWVIKSACTYLGYSNSKVANLVPVTEFNE